jgi:hypothetical protein
MIKQGLSQIYLHTRHLRAPSVILKFNPMEQQLIHEAAVCLLPELNHIILSYLQGIPDSVYIGAEYSDPKCNTHGTIIEIHPSYKPHAPWWLTVRPSNPLEQIFYVFI